MPADAGTAPRGSSDDNDSCAVTADAAADSTPADGTGVEGAGRHNGNGAQSHPVDVRRILSDPGIEGDPLQLLKVSEAYWKVISAGRPCLLIFPIHSFLFLLAHRFYSRKHTAQVMRF